MKKLFSLFVPLMALFLTLAPQRMWADDPDYFTITNTHATTGTAVHLLRYNANAYAVTLTFRILDKDDNVVLDWTTKEFSTTGTTANNNNRFGSSTTVIPANGGKMQIYGNNSNGLGSKGNATYNYFVFSGGTQEISGNILSMVACSDGQTINNNFTLPNYCFFYNFKGCTTLVSAADLKLPSLSLSSNQYQYYGMFWNCSNLEYGPKELPATSASATYVYNSMFRGCSKLKESPDIKAATWGTYGLNNMFYSCTVLNKIRIHTTYASLSQTNTWVNGVAGSGTFYCPPTLTRTKNTSAIPTGWTVYSYNVTFVLQAGTWEDATSANKQFTWETDVDNVTDFLDTESAADAVFYESDGVTPVTIATIKSRLSTQQESSASTTKTYYVKKLATFHITFKDNGGTTRYEQDILEGEMPSYGGASLDQVGYKLIWSPALYAADKDQIYTATYSLLYNFTASAGEHGTVQLTAADYADAENSSAYASGTSVQMTVVPNDGYRFVRWSDDGAGNTDNPRTVTTTSSASSYTAELEVIPTHYARFYDEDGTTLKYEVAVREGSTPVYAGPALTKQWHFFDGWSPALTAMGTSDVAYTAVYVHEPNYFTITNTHATQTLTVNMIRNNSSCPQPTFYYRISDKDGNITTPWTSKKLTTTNSTIKIGDISAGGKMEMYGDNSTGLASTSNMSYWTYFSFSANGTPKVSGNILSLVACSDGKTINNDFELPMYCFSTLFNGSTTLDDAEDLELPSTTLSERAYFRMFSGCTNLKKAPRVLPATTLPQGCYYQMFQNCSTLVKSPDIYGETMTGAQSSAENGSEGSMFSKCVNLSSIRTYMTQNWNGSTKYYTAYWVSNVQTTAGSFYCPRVLTRTTGGHYCIPSNWDIYSYDVTFVPVGGNWQDGTNTQRHFTWRTDVSDVNGFMTEQGERVVAYYRNSNLTNEITDMKALLTTQPSDDNTTYIYAEIGASANDVTLKANGGTGDDQVVSATNGSSMPTTLKDGETAISAPTAPAGYKFGGYYDTNESSGGTQYYTAALASARNWDKSSDTNLFARWTQKSYKLNLTSGGNGTVTRNDNGDSETVKRYYETVTLTPVASTGYHFTDWTGTDAGDLVDNEDGTYTFTIADKEDNYQYAVTANFAANTYHVSFDAGEGSGTMTDQEFTFGTAQNLTSNTYTAPTATITYNYNGATGGNTTPSVTVNATFTGWSDGTNTYTDGQEVNNLTAEDGATINLTAQWEFDYDDCQVTIPTPERTGYTFGGWQYEHEPGFVEDIEGGDTYYVSEDMTITANWTEVPAGTPHIDLYDDDAPKKDNIETDNATLLSSYPVGGTKTVDVTLHRKFTKNLWNTISLPFDFDTDGSVLNGKVFEMDKCTTSQDGMSISFLPVTWKEEEKTEMLAGQPYLVWTDTPIDEINFTGVQFKTFTAGTTLADPNGDVEFRAVFEDGYLTRKSSIFIGNGNHLYYAKQTDPGSRIRGYRGYFEIIKFNELKYTTPRVRIVINGEEVMSSEDNDTADIETRKYIEDGVLIIERGGVRYDAQGKRLE